MLSSNLFCAFLFLKSLLTCVVISTLKQPLNSCPGGSGAVGWDKWADSENIFLQRLCMQPVSQSHLFLCTMWTQSRWQEQGGEMMIAKIPVGLCFLCSLFQKQACIRKTDTKSTRTICPFFCAQHPHSCFWGEKQTGCFHVCSKKLLQHVGFDYCNCGLLWQLASGHDGAWTPHGGTNLCFHGIFKDSVLLCSTPDCYRPSCDH